MTTPKEMTKSLFEETCPHKPALTVNIHFKINCPKCIEEAFSVVAAPSPSTQAIWELCEIGERLLRDEQDACNRVMKQLLEQPPEYSRASAEASQHMLDSLLGRFGRRV